MGIHPRCNHGADDAEKGKSMSGEWIDWHWTSLQSMAHFRKTDSTGGPKPIIWKSSKTLCGLHAARSVRTRCRTLPEKPDDPWCCKHCLKKWSKA